MGKTAGYRSRLAAFGVAALLGCSDAGKAADAPVTKGADESLSITLLKPTRGLGAHHAQSNVCGGTRYACVDDGTSLAASDGDATYVYATDAGGYHITGYSGAPTGAVAQVTTHVVAAAAPGAAGTATVQLATSGTVIGSGAAHALSATYTEYQDTFAVAVGDANSLQTRVTFSSASLKYTAIWIGVTFASSPPPTDAGADVADGAPPRDAGSDSGGSRGTTWKAATCNASDVQSAINAASSGDTVLVPAGSCAWSRVTIPSSKGITLAGGSGGQTTISGSAALAVSAGSVAGTRVTGFTFTGVGTSNDGDVGVGGTKASAAYRIDHNVFTNAGQSVFVVVSGNSPGLIDHNTFTGGGASETIHNTGVGPSDTSGWTDDVAPGGSQMVFVEDNTFNDTDTTYIFSALQSYYGARTVFRHNVLNFAQVDQHGTGGMIGARWYEIYDNTFQPHGLNQCCYGAFRAGSGVVFDNHEIGSPEWGPAGFDFYEEDTGTWPLAFQVGSGINGQTDQHATCAAGTRNSSPVYVWGNDATIGIGSQTSSKVVQGRDYFVSATQPAQMYRQQLAADTCATTYAYAPYTYPHPLDAAGLPNP